MDAVGLVEFKKMGKDEELQKKLPKTPSKNSFNGFRQVKLETVNQ